MTTETKPYLDELPISEVREHPDNPRTSLGDVSELAASIKAHGILEPVVVQIDADATSLPADPYILVSGHRRLAAAKRAGLTHVPAIVHQGVTDRADQIELMLTENVQREDLTAIEEGDSYALLLDLGVSVDHLAKRLGKPKTHVRDRVKAAGLPESTRERILRGQVSLEHAARMQQFVKDDEVMKRLDRAAEGGPMSLDRAIEEEKTRADQAKAVAKVARELRVAGREVIVGEDERIESRSARHVAGVIYEWPAINDSRLPENYAALNHDDKTTEQLRVLEQQHFNDHPDGHLAVVESSSWSTLPRVRGYCLNKSAHADIDASQKEDPDVRAARAAYEAEEAKRHEKLVKLAAAGVVRRRFLGEVAARAATKLAREHLLDSFDLLTRAANNDSMRFAELRAFSEIVLPNLADSSRDEAGLGKKVAKALERCDLATLVVLSSIASSLGAEINLSSNTGPYAWDDDAEYSAVRKWRMKLRDTYGYEFSDVERELHAEHNTADEEGEQE